MALPTASPGPVAAAQAGTAAGGALTISSTYQWACTFYGNYGESGLGTPVSVALDSTHNQGSLTAIPTGPAGTVGRNIYRTKAGGTTFFFVANIPDNTTTTLTDALPDIGLGGAPTQFFLSQGDIQGAFLMFDDEAPVANAGYGLLNIGPGPWDGATTGFFAGSASGTGIAMNTFSGFAGNFLDFQRVGVSLLSVRSDGVLNPSGGGAAGNRGGVVVLTAGATPTDALWTTAPPIGMAVLDTVGAKIWFRTAAATWKGVVIA